MIIGLSGRAGSGKTTAANYLNDLGYRKDAYAKTLKAAASVIFKVPLAKFLSDNDVKSQVDPYWQMSYREMLQRLGTEACRGEFGEDIWERSLWRRHEDMDYDLVIDDVRFPNEAEAILRRGGIVIEILRIGAAPADNHRSEDRLPERCVSAIVSNSGTFTDLYTQIQAIEKTFCERRELQ